MNKPTLIVLMACCSISTGAYSSSAGGTDPHNSLYETTVIEDRGGRSIAEYMPHGNDQAARVNKRFAERNSTKLVHSQFPVVTKSMSVGRVNPDEAADIKYAAAMRPMFIVGYDPVSIEWIKENKELLSSKKAIGLVVNVANNQQMEELQRLAGDQVMMQPVQGDRMGEHLKIKHYPFYLDNKGVMR